jgi:hypothetical protein
MRNTFRGVLGALALSFVAPMAVCADEAPASELTATFEVGVRYWYSMGNSEFTLYDDSTPTNRVSALHYKNQPAHTAEAYFRADLSNHIFVKGNAAFGRMADGQLNDEDFPPYIVPYSSTISDLSGQIDYFTIDVGYTFAEQTNGENAYRVGGFVGFNYLHETFDAQGCTQIGLNPGICVPPDPSATLYITENNEYANFRVGLAGDVRLSQKLKLAAEGAYMLVDHDNLDTHYFTFGSLAAHGDGTGYQLEGLLTYDMYEASNIGIGARYWKMETEVYLDGFPQLQTYDVSRYGVFLQAGVKLN